MNNTLTEGSVRNRKRIPDNKKPIAPPPSAIPKCCEIRASKNLSLEYLREVNSKRVELWNKDSPAWTPADNLVELVGELGEAANVMKKLRRLKCRMVPHKNQTPEELDKAEKDYIAHLTDEMGDIVICVDLLAQNLGINLSQAVVNKFNKTSDKYGFPIKL